MYNSNNLGDTITKIIITYYHDKKNKKEVLYMFLNELCDYCKSIDINCEVCSHTKECAKFTNQLDEISPAGFMTMVTNIHVHNVSPCESNNTTPLIVRALTEDDTKAVQEIESIAIESDCFEIGLSNALDSDDYAWGVFKNNTLIGVCSMGGADCTDDNDIESHPSYTDDSVLLSDVYVIPEFRHKGNGQEFLKTVFEMYQNTYQKQSIFIELLDSSLCKFYETLEFTKINDYLMVRC